jgi:mRNA interferase MazF
MPINFHPKPGMVLICDFSTGFTPPEMVKKRPVVVVSKSAQQLVTVVPLSTTEPVPLEECHHELLNRSLPIPLRTKRHWAKCDCVTTVAFWRLDRVRTGIHPTTGKRTYVTYFVCPEDLVAIQKAVLHVLGLGHLIWPEQ